MIWAKGNDLGGQPQEVQPPQAVDISFLFISYSRSDLLEHSVAAIRESLKQDFPHKYEIVISDDCSPEPYAARIRLIGADTLVVSPKNKGLGFNHNQGIAACRGKYIVQIQDDWRFVGDAGIFSEAIRCFKTYDDIGLIRLTNPSRGLEYLEKKLEDTILRIYENDDIKGLRKCSARSYSDQPHIKRRQFTKDLGPYREGIKMSWMELDFQRRVANQCRWKIAYFVQEPIFLNLDAGAERSFNPVYLREARIARILSLPLIGVMLARLRPSIRVIRDILLFHRKIRD